MRSGAKTPRRSSATGQGFALPWMIGVVLLTLLTVRSSRWWVHYESEAVL